MWFGKCFKTLMSENHGLADSTCILYTERSVEQVQRAQVTLKLCIRFVYSPLLLVIVHWFSLVSLRPYIILFMPNVQRSITGYIYSTLLQLVFATSHGFGIVNCFASP